MWRLPFNNTNDLRRMGDVVESVAILIICYGVALQERGCLIKLFENPPVLFSHKEEQIDILCEGYGAIFLIIGLVIETIKTIVEIPATIINTDHIEITLYLVISLLSISTSVGIFLFTIRLWKLSICCSKEVNNE